MARFDVHHHRDSGVLLLDCQTDYLVGLETRLTAPLFKRAAVRLPIERLNPIMTFDGEEYVMMTQYMAAIDGRALGPGIASLAPYQDRIKSALDLLLDGF